ncbi:hypothetical protein HTV45_03815 [Streptomyces sp. CHD11]|uniref:hypothetical protein n=1 Tax=Streptomyces sp. CHD11 TaxID=2741325 RepID=UPI001BFCBE9D|nr:hypothetical protein [Streptomyces sp. CHD11]MBT3150032.1 hypothetical protein [Streptomyces sp. CHD11]
MNTRPLHLLLAADTAVIATACVAFALRHLGTGLYPDAMESWIEDHQWLRWAAAGILAPDAVVIPVLGLWTLR